MTPQEAKKMLKAKLECLKNETSGINYDCNMRLCDGCSLNYEQGNMGEQKEALDIAIKALEQRTSEDCISREAVLDIINNPLNIRLDEIIKKLPSVTPKAKTGHWIDIMVGDMQAQACDQCKTFYPLAYTGGGHRFCPNCGAKMVEPQESEDKE